MVHHQFHFVDGLDSPHIVFYTNGRTALRPAAEGGHLDVVERLLAAGAEDGHLDGVEMATGVDINAAAGYTWCDMGNTRWTTKMTQIMLLGHNSIVQKV
jgi:hypothetical protein